ncbi:MAG: hypothetical protein HQL32_03860 [Planctomycetes bacterium]|nr:hypothetical protein [Planctomycetota bacterium]
MTRLLFLLLVISLVASSIIFIWFKKPTMIEAIDAKVIAKYESYWKNEYEHCKKAVLTASPDKALDVINSFLQKLGQVEVKQRRARFYKEAILWKAQILKDSGNITEACLSLKEYIAKDPHELEVRVLLANYLLSDESTMQEGDALVKELYRLASAYDGIQDLYYEHLIAQNNPEEAMLAYEKQMELHHLPRCKVILKGKDSANTIIEVHLNWLDNNTITGRFSLPEGDFTQFIFTFNSSPHQVIIENIKCRINHTDIIVTKEASNSFSYSSQLSLSPKSRVSLECIAKLKPKLPQSLKNYLTSNRGQELKQECLSGTKKAYYKEILP